MKTALNKILEVLSSNRFKSFYWRTSMMVLATVVAFLSENLVDFNLPPYATVAIGLALGEVSKYLNSK